VALGSVALLHRNRSPGSPVRTTKRSAATAAIARRRRETIFGTKRPNPKPPQPQAPELMSRLTDRSGSHGPVGAFLGQGIAGRSGYPVAGPAITAPKSPTTRTLARHRCQLNTTGHPRQGRSLFSPRATCPKMPDATGLAAAAGDSAPGNRGR